MNQVVREFAGCWNGGPASGDGCATQCVYIFSSNPRPLPPHGRPTFRNNVPYPRGVGDFYNMMWDPRVRRGRPTEEKKSFIQCFNVRKPRTIKRRPRLVFERPPTPPRTIYSQYDGHVENMWEEINPELIEDENVVVDVEAALELPSCPSCNIPPSGIDVATEIAAGDLFDFERLSKPICEAFVGEIISASLLELLEEEELAALRLQQAKFEDLRTLEQVKLIELKAQQDRLDAEKARVDKQSVEYRQLHEAATNSVRAVAFAQFYLGQPLRDIKDGLVTNQSLIDLQILISGHFNTWINNLVSQEVADKSLCRQLLDDLILSTIRQREIEFQFEEWRQHEEQMALIALAAAKRFEQFAGEGDE